MESVSWQDDIYPDPQSDLIASGIYEEDGLLEDGRTKTIVSIIALFGFAVFLFGGIYSIYDLYYGTKNLFDPINWGLIFANAPLIYILGPLAFIISAGFLYLFFKLRTLTLRSLFFSVAFQVIAGDYMIAYILINQAATKGLDLTGTAEAGFHLVDFLDITFQILVVLVVAALLIIPFFSNRFNQKRSLSSTKRMGILAYSIVAVIILSVFYVPGMLASQEKPFVGFQKAKDQFGNDPVVLNIPSYTEAAFIMGDKSNVNLKVFSLRYLSKEDFWNMKKWITVNEVYVGNNIPDSSQIATKNEDSRTGVAFYKNGYAVVIWGESGVSKDTLLQIAKSAQ